MLQKGLRPGQGEAGPVRAAPSVKKERARRLDDVPAQLLSGIPLRKDVLRQAFGRNNRHRTPGQPQTPIPPYVHDTATRFADKQLSRHSPRQYSWDER